MLSALPLSASPARAQQDHGEAHKHGDHRGRERRAALPGGLRPGAGRLLLLGLQRPAHRLPPGRRSL